MGHLKRIMEQYQEPEFTAQGTPIEDFGPMPDDAMGSVIPYQRRVVKRIVIGTDGKRKTINRIMLVPVPPTVRRPATRVSARSFTSRSSRWKWPNTSSGTPTISPRSAGRPLSWNSRSVFGGAGHDDLQDLSDCEPGNPAPDGAGAGREHREVGSPGGSCLP